MFGLLNINKPLGLTSRTVVNRVAKHARPHKAGHAGTLDPLATGVLVVCIGPATRLVPYIQDQPKRYVGTFRLGKRSSTEDCEGELEDVPLVEVSRNDLEAVLPRFTGRIQQIPSAFSAIRVGGQRAYDLARKGREVDVPPREVEILSLQCRAFAFPDFTVEIECGSGTYIRSLGRDIAIALGNQCVMTSLQRTRIGPFDIADAVSLDDLPLPLTESFLIPPTRALPNLPTITLDEAECDDIRFGRTIRSGRFGLPAEIPASDDEVAAVDPAGRLVAILTPASGGILLPRMVFPA